MLIRVAIILLILGMVCTMPTTSEQSLFCMLPSPDLLASFIKAVTALDYPASKLATAASDTRAWDVFLTGLIDCCVNYPSIWDVAVEEYETRTKKITHGLKSSAKETIKLLVDPGWLARNKGGDMKQILSNMRKREPTYEDAELVSDLDEGELTKFSLIARTGIAQALRKLLDGSPLFRMIKTLINQCHPIDALVLMKYKMSLGRTEDTLRDTEVFYKNVRWLHEYDAQSFVNMYDEAFGARWARMPAPATRSTPSAT